MMRILLANDDGIDSPGLAALEAAARTLTEDLWTVAPALKWSGSSHSVSLHKQYALAKVGERRYRCSGTPVDCVVAAMAWIFKDGPKPDLVLSGINDGQNVAEDFAYSGTLSIAREATFWHVPAIAVSHAKGGDVIAPEAAAWLGGLVGRLWDKRADWVQPGHWLSLNLPKRFPASVRLATVGSDKIASAVDVTDGPDGSVLLQVRNRRSRAVSQDDESAILSAGFCSLVRLNWSNIDPLPEALISKIEGG